MASRKSWAFFFTKRGCHCACIKVLFKPCPFLRFSALGETGWYLHHRFVCLFRRKEVIIHSQLQHLSRLNKQIIFPCKEQSCWLSNLRCNCKEKKVLCSYIIVSSPPSNQRALSALCIPANVPWILLFSQCLQAVFGDKGFVACHVFTITKCQHLRLSERAWGSCDALRYS